MNETRESQCPSCNATIASDSVQGLCPKCLLEAGLAIAADETNNSFEEATIALGVKEDVICETTQESSDAAAKDEGDRSIGDYELIEEIARGGMGVVYRARQRSLNRPVALKMILGGNLASEEDRARFQMEAEAAAKLDHPGIVPIFEVGHEKGPNGDQHYYSMALIEGESLADQLDGQPMSNADAVRLMISIASAVEYAHQNSIIHRDLKPANILIDGQGQPRITDFGLAKKTDADSQLTATGQMMGTPSFMPPEQVAGKTDQIGPASDVYSLGAILYIMITGKPPFAGETLLQTLTQVLEREPESPIELNGDIDIDLETVCMKCLEKNPEERFKSVCEFADELERIANDEPIQSRQMSAWERIRRWQRMVRRNPDVRIQSRTKLLGVPLVSIAYGKDVSKDEETGTAKGIFAFGDRAFGVFASGRKAYGIIAFGLHARGGITLGFTSVGVISSGMFSLGAISLGGIAAGVFAVGCVTIGYTGIGMLTIARNPLGAFRWRI